MTIHNRPFLPESLNVIHPECASLFRAPLTKATGKAAQIEHVDKLLQAQDSGVILRRKDGAPFVKLTTKSDVGAAHGNANHVLPDVRDAVNLRQCGKRRSS